VIIPTLASRVEETHEFAGLTIDRTDIAPLPCITSKASIGKVVRIREPSMFAAHNVIYLMRRVRVGLMKEAILAPVGSALRDESP
jgi:hypothetical protein